MEKLDKTSIIIWTILILLAVFTIFATIDSKSITTNKTVDCIDERNNFISNQICYKRVRCGEKIKLFDSKYCASKYINSEKGEEK